MRLTNLPTLIAEIGKPPSLLAESLSTVLLQLSPKLQLYFTSHEIKTSTRENARCELDESSQAFGSISHIIIIIIIPPRT